MDYKAFELVTPQDQVPLSDSHHFMSPEYINCQVRIYSLSYINVSLRIVFTEVYLFLGRELGIIATKDFHEDLMLGPLYLKATFPCMK